MRRGNLTDLTIRSLAAPPGNRIEVWDSKIPGFGVRVSPIGTKTFVLFYHLNGRKTRLSLGRFPHIKLAEARAKAHAILGQVSDGTDPRQHDTHSSNKLRFEHVVEEFIAKHCAVHNRKSTAKETARLLRVRFARQWAARDIRQIGRGDIVAVLDDAMKSNTPSAANHAFSAVSKLFSWCVARGIIEINPCLGVSRPAPAKSDLVCYSTANCPQFGPRPTTSDFQSGRLLSFLSSQANAGERLPGCTGKRLISIVRRGQSRASEPKTNGRTLFLSRRLHLL